MDWTDPGTIVALAAAAVAIVALLACAALALRLHRVRGDQRAVLGEDGSARDLVTHSAQLEQEFDALHRNVSEAIDNLHQRLERVEQHLERAVAHHALVRYDAYGELSGKQSMSIALLDAERSGLVLSSIAHRDQARMYAKRVERGHAEIELSPEEAEAVRLAMAVHENAPAPP